MIYMLSASIWTINLQFLDQKIKQISFAELREPSVEINSRLHDCRQDLEYLRDGVMNIHKHETPGDVNAILALFDDLKPGDSSSGVTRNAFKQLDQDVSNLSAFLMDSFQLLMSTIATLDAQTSLEQANRGSRLTQLAFIYIPLSFVTGIFGMNLKEINGSPLSAWVTVVSLFILALFTAIIFWLLRMFEKRRANKV
jgi:Mg2+ and Co2+ transporter CorA